MIFTIRDAKPFDRAIIADFNSRLSAETEGGPLDASVIDAGVAVLLSDPSKGRYWLAESNHRIVGQIMVTYEWSDWRNGMLWWIQSVYVHEAYRRKGVFSMLFRHVESLARDDSNVAGIRLYVQGGNARAQATYKRLGMTATGYRVMQKIF